MYRYSLARHVSPAVAATSNLLARKNKRGGGGGGGKKTVPGSPGKKGAGGLKVGLYKLNLV